MKLSLRDTRLKKLGQANDWMKVLLFVCVLIIGSQHLHNKAISHKSQSILVPLGMTVPLAVGEKADMTAYLNALSIEIAQWLFNMHPSNADFRMEQVLKVTHSGAFHEMQARLKDEVAALKEVSGSMTFHVSDVSTVPGRHQTLVKGYASVIANKEKVLLQEPREYLLVFHVEDMQVTLSDYQLVEGKKHA